MAEARITVLRRTFQAELVAEEICDPDFRATFERCPIFREGQSFIAEGWPAQPSGFCPRAWHNIRHEVEMVMHGARAPWIAQGTFVITCCNDGLRPVIFRIERVAASE